MDPTTHPGFWALWSEAVSELTTRPLDLVYDGGYGPSAWAVPGVYQLTGPEHSYVGASKNVRKRVATHFYPGSELLPLITRARVLTLFDTGVSWRDLLNAEAHWGMLLRPTLNKAKWRFVRSREHRDS